MDLYLIGCMSEGTFSHVVTQIILSPERERKKAVVSLFPLDTECIYVTSWIINKISLSEV